MGTDNKARIVSFTPAIVAAAYGSGDQIGGVNTLSDAMDTSSDTGTIVSIAIVDKAKQKAALDILFFSSSPTLASSDNAALDISDAEMAAKYLGKVTVAAADYVDLANSSHYTALDIGLKVKSAAGSQDVYAVVQSRGTPTYASTSDLVIKVGIDQD